MRFPEFEGEWEEVIIKDYGTVVTGNTPSTKEPENYINGCIPWVSPADLGKKKYIYDTKSKLSKVGFSKARAVPKGTILVTCIGSTIGKIGVAASEMATNQQINSIIVDNHHNNNFVYYSIQKRFPRYIDSIAVQAVPILSKSTFEGLQNYSTTKEEQDKIGHFLELVDQRIDTQIKIIEELERLKTAFINRLLVRTKCNKNHIGFSDLKSKWSIVRIKDVVSSKTSKYNPQVNTEELVCIELDCIEQESGRLLHTLVSTEQESLKSRFSKGNVLFNKLRPYLKKYHYCLIEGVCSSEFWVLNSNIVDTRYLYYYVQTSEFLSFASVSSGSKMPRADWKYVSEQEMHIPTKSEQRKIADFLTAIDNKIRKERNMLHAYREQKDYFLQNLFI